MNEANGARRPKKLGNWVIGLLLALVAVGAYALITARIGGMLAK
jgi:hypothetical protein